MTPNPLSVSTASTVHTIKNVNDLRNHEPHEHGQLALVLEYHSGSLVGGGLFCCDMGDWRSPDDGGYIFVTQGGKRWRRYISDLNRLNVTHFGAIPDGQTDCVEAVKRMWEWSRILTGDVRQNEDIGIKFPAGRFFISSFDIADDFISWDATKFRLAGESVYFGYHNNTYLVSNNDSNFMFRVKARFVEITGLAIDGRSDYNGQRNQKGFYENTNPGGQFLRVSCMIFKNMGGRSLSLLDTLDCKIDQFYASHCHETVVYARWSDQIAGSWHHVTAIELSNFNIQHGRERPMIDLTRSSQSLIWNGWIEHTEFPGDISNGQWTITALNIETCPNPLKAHHCRIISTQLNLQAGSWIDTSDQGEKWLSEWEMGRTWFENHGARIEGSISYDYVSSTEYMDNQRQDEAWFLLGQMHMENWQSQTQIKLIGSSEWYVMRQTQTDFDPGTSEGRAELFLHNVQGTVTGSWSCVGSSPVTRVHLETAGNNRVNIYLKINKYTAWVKAFVTTSSPDRFNNGVTFRFDKKYQRVEDQNKINEIENAAVNCFNQTWIGNRQVGIGYNNDNELLFRGRIDNNQLVIRVNGQRYGIPLNRL
ncbi:hypothetical protein EHW64_09305 [Erwinia psidii]|uniref:hypothetical protein n=1 Tax=Erwinia psidii TaxID=69224 RepID=UPI00226B35E9|nr:hypothetical protein [Erwinia psidii]MCX8961345.1 hypothetical protein [Erwinia psidii]